MGGLLERAASLLDRRFLNAFLPVVLLAGGGTALTLAAVGEGPDAAATWTRLDTVGKAMSVLAAVALAWFAAGVMASQFRNLTQFYEGYPLGRSRRLRAVGDAMAEYHYERRERWIGERSRADQAYYAYPEDREHFLPTALGNALRSAEYYPKYRYGAPTTFLWPRPFYLTPEQYRRDVEEFRTDYEWLLGVSFLSAVVAITSGTVQLVVGAPWWTFALTFGGGCLLSLLAYRASVPAAEEYGAQLRAGVDLYRTEVLARLRWGVPDSPDDEMELWDEAHRFHHDGLPRTRPYAAFQPPIS
jgi:hypothetical protein